MMSRITLFSALSALLFAGCPSGGGTASTAEPTLPSPGTEAEVVVPPKRARLVLSVVLDQVPSSAMLRFAPYLPEDGVLRRAMEEGLFEERVRYGYAGTNTAPGHASIYTGELPADHGIDRNDLFSTKTGGIKIINDGEHAVFGVEGAFAGPRRLLKPTIGDLLHTQQPESKVVSVSLKARAAVVSGGKSADFVTWYDPRLPGFTTSEFYSESMPSWLTEWNSANPFTARLQSWLPEDPKLYETLLGPDDAPGESDWYGLGTTFPHESKTTKKPSKTFVATPGSMDYLLDMTRTLVAQYQLGADEHPDLLMVSISTTDYAGHSFGIDSWEYLDVLIKTDRALGVLVRELETQTDLAVVVTSDHGGTPLAEHSVAQGKVGGRLFADAMLEDLEKLADKKLGKAQWFEDYIQPFLYLTEHARNSDKHAELLSIVTTYAQEHPKVEAIYSSEQARQWRNSDNWLQRDVANTVSARSQALFVVPARGHVAASTRGTLGTGHGTPWDTDREVSLVAFGVGVSPSHGTKTVEQNRVAPTIAALLGLPWHLDAKSL